MMIFTELILIFIKTLKVDKAERLLELKGSVVGSSPPHCPAGEGPGCSNWR